MTVSDAVAIGLLIVVCLFLVHVPLLKPWFGFRKPRGHRGHWFE